MSFPDTRGPRIPKRHPACPGKRRCRLPGCIHNVPISIISTGEISVDLYEADGNATHGANYPPDTCVRDGASYQRLDAGSELGSNDRGINGEMNGTVCTKVLFVQAKIQEVSRRIIDRMRSCF